MRNHKESYCAQDVNTYCAGCHYATPTIENCAIAAHCVVFNMPIYSEELYDQHSDLREMCRSTGNHFTAALSDISLSELYEWQILQENTVTCTSVKRVYTVAEVVRVGIAIITLLASLYQLFF